MVTKWAIYIVFLKHPDVALFAQYRFAHCETREPP